MIDKGHYWAVKLDDVDAAQADIEWLNKFSDDASEQLKIKVDTKVLGSVYADVSATNKGTTAGRKSAAFNLGTTGSSIALDATNILDYIVYCGAVLDEANVPETGRWFVLSPLFIQMVKRSDIKDASLSGDGTSVLRNGRVGQIDRFTIYSSNLLTSVTDGNDTCYHLLCGHKDAVTFAGQVTKTERLRGESAFGELVRGLFVYGFKTVKTDAIADLYAKKA